MDLFGAAPQEPKVVVKNAPKQEKLVRAMELIDSIEKRLDVAFYLVHATKASNKR
jgi:hypothetical protein